MRTLQQVCECWVVPACASLAALTLRGGDMHRLFWQTPCCSLTWEKTWGSLLQLRAVLCD